MKPDETKSIFYDRKTSKFQLNGETLTNILGMDKETVVSKKTKGRTLSLIQDKKKNGTISFKSPLLSNINREVTKEL